MATDSVSMVLSRGGSEHSSLGLQTVYADSNAGFGASRSGGTWLTTSVLDDAADAQRDRSLKALWLTQLHKPHGF